MANLIVARETVSDSKCSDQLTKREHRVPSKRLTQDCFYVRQRRSVFEGGQPLGADHSIDFHLYTLLHIWEEHHAEDKDNKR